ncbi:hypothetical protein [Glutamicibacter creatinolyticus]|uniref:hypothetical protein n=1 Tax=Glutamicibacter creatinolyticus TaxID=162496 RepID=UPI0031DF428D
MGIVSSFPKKWRISVVVLRGGGRNSDGTVRPTTEIPLKDCLFGPRSTGEPVDRSEQTTGTPTLYRDPDPAFSFESTDRIRIPNGNVYAVDGEPEVWPLGVAVPLRKE